MFGKVSPNSIVLKIVGREPGEFDCVCLDFTMLVSDLLSTVMVNILKLLLITIKLSRLL